MNRKDRRTAKKLAKRHFEKPAQKTPKSIQQSIVAAAEAVWHQKYANVGHISAGCLYWAIAAIEAAASHGIRLVLQAGSHAWPCVDLKDDDGVSNTHFAYEWEGMTDFNRGRMAQLLMPEMHVWAGRVDTQELIDLTTQYLPTQCHERLGMEWRSPTPPKYLWTKQDEMPDGVVYKPDKLATEVAVNLLETTMASLKSPGGCVKIDLETGLSTYLPMT